MVIYPGVYAGVSKFPSPRYSFVITFGCAQQNVNKLIASALDEVNKLKSQGPALVNVEKYKAEKQRSQETEVKTNKFWLGYLSGYLQNNDPLTALDRFAYNLQSVTTHNLKLSAQ